MAQREPARLELVLERGAIDSALNARCLRGLVDLEHTIEMSQIQSHDGSIGLRRLHAAYHAGAAAPGNDNPLIESHQSRADMISLSLRGNAITSGGFAKSRANAFALS
jgi:hypothetical protein